MLSGCQTGAIVTAPSALADQLWPEITGLLSALVLKEVLLGQTFYKDTGVKSSLLHMTEVVGKTVHAQTGSACSSTWDRNLGDKSPGVSKSTRTPNKASSSACSPPKSNSVVPGRGSTKRSMSLSSRSVPCRTDPKTRRLAARKRRTAARAAVRFFSNINEGRMDDFWAVAAADGRESKVETQELFLSLATTLNALSVRQR